MPSKSRRLPWSPDVSAFRNQPYLVNLAARMADLAFFGNAGEYQREAAEANRHLSKAEVGFVLGWITCMNDPPEEKRSVEDESASVA